MRAALPLDPPVWLVAHRAGRDRQRLRAALASPATHVEIDVWLEGRGPKTRAASRHDPLLHPRLPWLTVRHRLPHVRLRRLWLAEIAAPGRIFLDFKDPDPAVVEATVAALRSSGSLERATASTPYWGHLDRLAVVAPEVARLCSVSLPGSTPAATWDHYVARIAEGRGGDGVSLNHRLATPERLAFLRDQGLRAVCWTVNDAARGHALLATGASGLTTDRWDLLRAWRAAAAGLSA